MKELLLRFGDHQTIDLQKVEVDPLLICGVRIEDDCMNLLRLGESQRATHAEAIKKKYTHRLPVVLLRSEKCGVPALRNNKFLFPSNFRASDIAAVIRKRVGFSADRAVFLYSCQITGQVDTGIGVANQKLLRQSDLLGIIHNRNKSIDGFLYLLADEENTYG